MKLNITKIVRSNEIVDLLAKFRQIFIGVAVFTAVINILMLVPSIYMLELYDRVLGSRNEFTLLMLTVMAVGLFGLSSLLEYFRSMIVVHVGDRIDQELNQRVFTAAFEQNLGKNSVDAGQALGDLNTVKQFVTGPAMFAFFDAPWFPIYLGIIFMFDPWLGLFATASTATLIGLAAVNELVLRQPTKQSAELALRSSNMASANLRNAEVIDAMGMLPAIRRRWYNTHRDFLSNQIVANSRGARFTAVTKFVRITVQSLILGLAAYLVIQGSVTAGMMIAASILLGRSLAPVEQIISQWRQFAIARAAYGRLTELLQANPEREKRMSLPRPKGRVATESLTAGVLKTATFDCEPGDCVAVVGPSGSGKTTLARLLVGVARPDFGTVRLDGAEVQQYNRDELGQAIGYLPQDIELFAGTIAENIARFDQVDAEQVIAAARLAGVHDMIISMPNGYETQLGINGSGLSGGERQRVALARALYNRPSIVVLDEPNSNLDIAGDQALSQAVAQLRNSGTTVFIVTHRPDIIDQTNKILVLNQGLVASFGPTQQILNHFKTSFQPSTLSQV